MFKKFFKKNIVLSISILSILISILALIFSILSLNGKSLNQNNTLDELVNGDKYFQGENAKETEYILGNPKNKITLFVYSDPECPYCKIYQEKTIQKLQEKYLEDKSDFSKSKISIVYRNFAQSYHTKAPTEINALLCSREFYGQNVYINALNELYKNTQGNDNLDLNLLPKIIENAINLSKENKQNIKQEFKQEEFVNCYKNNTFNQEFLDNQNDAIKAGLEGTPYSVLTYNDGNKNIIISKISGARDVDYLEKFISKLLKIKK